jgi:hypothetical protein
MSSMHYTPVDLVGSKSHVKTAGRATTSTMAPDCPVTASQMCFTTPLPMCAAQRPKPAMCIGALPAPPHGLHLLDRAGRDCVCTRGAERSRLPAQGFMLPSPPPRTALCGWTPLPHTGFEGERQPPTVPYHFLARCSRSQDGCAVGLWLCDLAVLVWEAESPAPRAQSTQQQVQACAT